MQTVPLFLQDDPDTSSIPAADRPLFDEFRTKGYAVIDLDIADLPDRIIEGVKYGSDPTRIQDAWKTVPAVKELALNTEVERVLALLYGREPFAFQTLNFPVGTQQLTHSDTIHFSSLPKDFMAGVWVALEDTDAENGPLHYYPGSHTMPHLTMDDLGVSKWGKGGYKLYSEHYEPAIRKLCEGMKPLEAHLRKGQALIWSANLLHGGNPIIDRSRSRQSQVTHYYFEGCRYWTPMMSTNKRRFHRTPYKIRSGKAVTPFGEYPKLLAEAGKLCFEAYRSLSSKF
ncbi:phytanoyl-CoA dioxygenase family protein [Croceicoccus naphthovorans]|uniref:phytanoyl-CoA dioxygenase family protein n=1 Tax=Croceicoccus naphthovorans TaxID=1348774 RepID=UPI00069CD692|nr:phytanoyl-CoA dioxygenase family protein [Croceicoccus naphthovorans]MBB3991346.1 hypothetical protein [Croceicoccus naphthovorans]